MISCGYSIGKEWVAFSQILAVMLAESPVTKSLRNRSRGGSQESGCREAVMTSDVLLGEPFRFGSVLPKTGIKINIKKER